VAVTDLTACFQVNNRIEVVEVDIEQPVNKAWYDLYKNDIPVGHIDGKEFFRHRIDEDTVLEAFNKWVK